MKKQTFGMTALRGGLGHVNDDGNNGSCQLGQISGGGNIQSDTDSNGT